MLKKILTALTLLLLIGLLAFFFVLPGQIGRRMNAISASAPAAVSSEARALHDRLAVVDLHADTLLWDRDPLERGTWGHVDVPRMIEGRVALQGFTIVTKTPRGQNIESNDASTDNITLLAVAERWPVAAWSSLTARALHQCRRLQEAASRSAGKLTLVRSRADLEAYLARRASEPEITAGWLGIEGAQALDGRLENLDRLYDAGVRMVGLAHFFDNEFAGSAHGVAKGGLSEAGRELIRRIEARRMLVDLAHASPPTIDQVLQMATRPLVVSHTGVRGTCDNARNLSDEHLRGIARTGGVVGIGYWETAVCGTDPAAIARAIQYAVRIAGIDHVGLGSDYDGAVTVPFDTSQLALLTEALLKAGFNDDEIARIMGGNALRVLRAQLP